MSQWTNIEISEYPYSGTITSVTQGEGEEDDVLTVIYQGVMDEHMKADEVGDTLQTSSYIISIPLTKDDNGKWIVPQKGDKIECQTLAGTINLTIDNVEPSQLGGVSINATRNDW
jgi:hypothetical protein